MERSPRSNSKVRSGKKRCSASKTTRAIQDLDNKECCFDGHGDLVSHPDLRRHVGAECGVALHSRGWRNFRTRVARSTIPASIVAPHTCFPELIEDITLHSWMELFLLIFFWLRDI